PRRWRVGRAEHSLELRLLRTEVGVVAAGHAIAQLETVENDVVKLIGKVVTHERLRGKSPRFYRPQRATPTETPRQRGLNTVFSLETTAPQPPDPMTPRPVHWHEGMFLRPHHFQAADRFAARVLAQNIGLVRSHGWGLGHCVIDAEALGGFRLVVRGLEARFRDGAAISLPAEGPLRDLALNPAFADRTSLDVAIAIPKWRPGQPNLHSP